MAAKSLPWFRVYSEAAFDPKFDIAAMQLGMSSVTIFGVWVKLLCIANGSPVRGALYVTSMKRFCNDDIAAMLRFGNDDCNAILNKFIELDMLNIGEDSAYHVTNWDKRQYISDNSTPRVQDHRNKMKKHGGNADETLHDRYGNVSVTPSDTDTDTDTDTETETETETEQIDVVVFSISQITGLAPTPGDFAAAKDILEMGATTEDIQAGYDWLVKHRKTVKYASQLVGPTRTAMGHRTQSKVAAKSGDFIPSPEERSRWTPA